MATTILIIAIIGLFFGGILMAGWSKATAQLDTRISLWIGYRLFPRRMRRHWGSREEFKKFLARKKILTVYKIAGAIAVLVAIGLLVFLSTTA
jgi:hypothetical protein